MRIGSFFSVCEMNRPDVVTLREEDLDLLDPHVLRHRNHAGRDLLVGLEHDLARGRVDHVGGRKGPLELRGLDLDGLDVRRAQGPRWPRS